jgi:hypothetical protein
MAKLNEVHTTYSQKSIGSTLVLSQCSRWNLRTFTAAHWTCEHHHARPVRIARAISVWRLLFS